jgi:preprotein translocase subunit SecF
LHHGIFQNPQRHSLHEACVDFHVISLVTFLLAVFFLFSRGLHLSVEFTGGTVMEVSYSQPADLGKVRSVVSSLGLQRCTSSKLWHSPRCDDSFAAQKGVSVLHSKATN